MPPFTQLQRSQQRIKSIPNNSNIFRPSILLLQRNHLTHNIRTAIPQTYLRLTLPIVMINMFIIDHLLFKSDPTFLDN